MDGTNLTKDKQPYHALITALLIKQGHGLLPNEIPSKVSPYNPHNAPTDDLNPNNLTEDALTKYLNREYAETSALQKKYFKLAEFSRKIMERIHKITQVAG